MDRVCVPPAPRHWARFGRSIVVPPARIEGSQWVRIGDGVVVLEHLWLSVVATPERPPPLVMIADHVRVGRGCQFSVLGELTIEEGAIIGDFVHLADTWHRYDVDDPLPVEAMVDPRPVRIGRGAVLGSHVTVLPGVTVGAGAFVEHHAVVHRDVAPGATVAGSPARPVATNPQ
jgi:serine acetyltransferase